MHCCQFVYKQEEGHGILASRRAQNSTMFVGLLNDSVKEADQERSDVHVVFTMMPAALTFVSHTL